jgi:23S rRNA pseudouridine2605 synthase
MKSKVKSAAKTPAKAERAPKGAVSAAKSETKKKTASGKAEKATAKTRAAGAKASQKKRLATNTTKAAETLLNAKPEVTTAAKTAKARAKSEESVPRAGKAAVKPAGAKKRKRAVEPAEGAGAYRIGEPVLDPIGDTTDGKGHAYLGAAETLAKTAQSNVEVDAFRKETRLEASDTILEAGPGMEAAQEAMEKSARKEAVETASALTTVDSEAATPNAELHEPGKLERLQKILSQAGVASRRRAEEMITEGRVMVNGQVVTTLGSKADPERDHIRVDGKLLHGAERHRYFLLNKPRGYVTTVNDPENRPTVMKFFEKMHERLYPVGRLDYQSEGLLLMTNDGELANLLTKAGSGVEKSYLVKVAGRPTEEELEKLRSGVTIERGEAGSGRVRTAPARVRQVRVGDNPWFEVVLIEGRNRELRKMFSAIGHYVEKIRRVGYGPLALDIEPGKMRELAANEVTALRLTAEGKMKPRHVNADRMLPKDAGRAAEGREAKRGGRGGKDFPRRDGGERGAVRDGGNFDRRRSGGFERRERNDFPKREGSGFQRRQSGGFGRGEEGGIARRSNMPFAARNGEFRRKRDGEPGRGPAREGFASGPRQDRGERKGFEQRGEQRFDRRERRPFRAHGERPYFKPREERQGHGENARSRDFEKGPRKNWGPRPEVRRGAGPRGEDRGPRQGAPEFRGQGRKFGGRKPGFGGKPGSFGGPRREGGRGGSRPGGGRGFGGRKRG